MLEYDVVVVGAGSAGCALTGQLCQSPALSVCLVEAGPDYGSLADGQWPAELLDSQQMPETHDWGYSLEQVGGFGVPEARAKVIGGCSAHNQCAALWGPPDDYNAWAEAGNQGWGYAELAPLIQRIERAPSEPPSAYRGLHGVLPTRPYRDEELASWQRLLLETATGAGFPRLTDLSTPEPAEGVAPFHANVKDRIRWNAAFAFLDSIRPHPRLTILSNTIAEKLILQQETAVSLLCHTQGSTLELRASTFVLCCGTYGSPLLLMRSGIGPAQHLQEVGIPPRIEARGVGQNLHDHPGISMSFEPQEFAQQLLAEDLAHHCFAQSQVILRVKSKQCPAGFDLHILPYQMPPDEEAGRYEILVFHLAPRSRGQVLLRGKEVHLPPRIDFQFFSDPDNHDATVLLDGVERVRQLMQKEPLASAITGEREPGPQISTASDLRAYTHTHLTSYGHPVGTCKMGPGTDPAAVVDSFGQVYGTGNVFVADASIMPRIPRANTNLTCFLIGFHLAELLAAKLSRP